MKLADLDFDKGDKKVSASTDRIGMIKEVFELTLNREPSSRELSFYKYGNQEREEMIEKILNDKEHTDLLKRAKESPELEDRAKQAEHKVLQLKQQTEDMKDEIVQTRELLDQKNREIAILRREKQDPYNFTHSQALMYIKGLTENKRTEVDNETTNNAENNHFTTISPSENRTKRTFLDKIYDLIRSN
ncbi:MAG: hypothetical protein PHG60_00580 [Candidatus Dojkabacteria bacterium]|jgi:hypothetical protein|nr:hypothetical protein [Candidatus Dojkabacteria bacterium]MDD2270072.1 hypothetical protein [Candidatus Dojkabacteria bacterium]